MWPLFTTNVDGVDMKKLIGDLKPELKMSEEDLRFLEAELVGILLRYEKDEMNQVCQLMIETAKSRLDYSYLYNFPLVL